MIFAFILIYIKNFSKSWYNNEPAQHYEELGLNFTRHTVTIFDAHIDKLVLNNGHDPIGNFTIFTQLNEW